MYTADAFVLNCSANHNKSKERRLRAANVKRRMWAVASYQCVGFQPLFVPPWWQPEPENSEANVGDHVHSGCECHQHVNAESHDTSRASGHEYDGNHEPSPRGGILSVAHSMDALNAQLCEWLYGDGLCAMAGRPLFSLMAPSKTHLIRRLPACPLH